PDHDTICTFRRNNKEAFESSFIQVLELAQEMKLLRVGKVSVDGTKIKANASKHAAVSYERAGEMTEQLRLEVQELMQKAEDADSTPLEDGLSIPQEIKRREDRMAQLEMARKEIEKRSQARAAAEQEEYKSKVAARKARRDRGETVRGREPVVPDETPRGKDQYNFTDPQSRIMKAGSGDHFAQSYNAQAAVDAESSMLILGQRVTEHCNDKRELAPTVEAIAPELGEIEVVIADSGFYSESAVAQVEAKGIEAYVAVEKGRHHKTVADLEKQPQPTPLPEDASAKEKMVHRLRTPGGKETYSKRHQTVEPVFGIIKQALGFRQFLLRGIEKVSIEWNLITLAYNFKRLHTLSHEMTRGGVCPAAAKRT
ncbi:MAG: transposase, partial [Abditibacteriaceae bacterium]